jgi:hypothetical protein
VGIGKQYYALAALGVRVSWKQALTQLQIIQFVIDVAACAFAGPYPRSLLAKS